MKYSVIVATHHKTGTVWMDGVFKAVAARLGVTYLNFKAQYGQLSGAVDKPFILLNGDIDFRDHAGLLDRRDVRILHLIRDPRDVVISAMHYHKKSNESWLHEPVPGYDNVTYQRRLKELPTRHQQYVYEMEHSSAATIHDMLAWRYGRPNAFEARYEELRRDTELRQWRRITAFLGFDEREQEICDDAFWRNSLFGSLPRLGNKHVRSGDAGQWTREFTVPLAYAFIGRFPGALQSLGYERDHGWIVELQQTRADKPRRTPSRAVGNALRPLRELSRTFSFF
ncbi:MAG: sulfotransferase domain-containing protein [Proteobacteria bacterium]|nr:sulfotransferase domain-containing protein [Pseudomonadota bacterium]